MLSTTIVSKGISSSANNPLTLFQTSVNDLAIGNALIPGNSLSSVKINNGFGKEDASVDLPIPGEPYNVILGAPGIVVTMLSSILMSHNLRNKEIAHYNYQL